MTTRAFALASIVLGAAILLLSWVVAIQEGWVVPVAIGTATGAAASYAVIRGLR